jgi:hypothetical protein
VGRYALELSRAERRLDHSAHHPPPPGQPKSLSDAAPKFAVLNFLTFHW